MSAFDNWWDLTGSELAANCRSPREIAESAWMAVRVRLPARYPGERTDRFEIGWNRALDGVIELNPSKGSQ